MADPGEAPEEEINELLAETPNCSEALAELLIIKGDIDEDPRDSGVKVKAEESLTPIALESAEVLEAALALPPDDS